MEDYENFASTCENMMTHLLGNIDFNEMSNQKGAFGLTFYFIYISLMTFLVLNIFYSILGDAFTTTQAELKSAQHTYELLDFIKSILKVSVIHLLKCRLEINLIYVCCQDFLENLANFLRCCKSRELVPDESAFGDDSPTVADLKNRVPQTYWKNWPPVIGKEVEIPAIEIDGPEELDEPQIFLRMASTRSIPVRLEQPEFTGDHGRLNTLPIKVKHHDSDEAYVEMMNSRCPSPSFSIR
jgi:hypothetical protein